MALKNKKHLGQHWLKDAQILAHIAEVAELGVADTILEIGPGLGTLTSRLLKKAGAVVAVEFDEELAQKLPAQFLHTNLTVVNQDILTFDTRTLPPGYKVVANVPYYITSKIIHTLSEAVNPPEMMVLLVQKEVAERLAAEAGEYSILAIATQVFYEVEEDIVVGAQFFTPPPKVDSQVVILRRRPEALVPLSQRPTFFRVMKAGFSAKRKKLRSSLAGGLGLSKQNVEVLLQTAGMSPDVRAEDLSIQEWQQIADGYRGYCKKQ